MKKFLTKAAILAFGFGVATVFTACHSGSGESTQTYDVTDNVTFDRTLVVTVNGATGVSVTYGSTALSLVDGAYVLENAAANGVLTVTATGNYVVKEFTDNISFGDKTLVTRAYNFTALAPAVDRDQVVAGGTTGTTTTEVVIENGDENAQNEGSDTDDATASITIPAGTDVNLDDADGDDGFSITVFTPEGAGDKETAEEVGANDAAELPALALNCTPDGAKFGGEGVKVAVKVPGAEGVDLQLRSGNESAQNVVTSDDGTLTANLTHFSVWDIILYARVVNKRIVSNEVIGEGNLTAGSNIITYKKYIGFETQEVQGSILYKYLQSYFGAALRQVNARARLSASAAGTYTVIQDRYEITFNSIANSGSSRTPKEFKAYIYGSPRVTVTTATPPSTHSGGSN